MSGNGQDGRVRTANGQEEERPGQDRPKPALLMTPWRCCWGGGTGKRLVLGDRQEVRQSLSSPNPERREGGTVRRAERGSVSLSSEISKLSSAQQKVEDSFLSELRAHGDLTGLVCVQREMGGRLPSTTVHRCPPLSTA